MWLAHMPALEERLQHDLSLCALVFAIHARGPSARRDFDSIDDLIPATQHHHVRTFERRRHTVPLAELHARLIRRHLAFKEWIPTPARLAELLELERAVLGT